LRKRLKIFKELHRVRFIKELLNVRIDAPRLLERLNIRVPSSTRLQRIFYLPSSHSNFAKYAPLATMMRGFNNCTQTILLDFCYCYYLDFDRIIIYHLFTKINVHFMAFQAVLQPYDKK